MHYLGIAFLVQQARQVSAIPFPEKYQNEYSSTLAVLIQVFRLLSLQGKLHGWQSLPKT